jgi:GGDEF domain-containing protein
VPKIAWVTGIATAISVAFVAWLTGGRGDQHTVGVISLIILGLLVIIVLTRQFIVVAKIRRLLVMAADQALRDPLTGLANRALFHDRLTHAMQLHQRDNQSVAVLSLDLDDFKMVNDNLGHPAGDALLVLAAERILGCVRAGDTVARLGGDEFAVLLEGRAEDSHLVAPKYLLALGAGARPHALGHRIRARPGHR